MDISADFLLIDDTELVTVTVAATGVAHPDVVAYRVGDSFVEGEPSEGGYLYRETKFRLDGTGAYTPKPGDIITDVVPLDWVIQDVQNPSVHNCEWQCRCRVPHITEDVVSGLQNRVALWRATYANDDWGSQIVTHVVEPLFEDVPAKIMLRPSVVTEEGLGQRDFVEQYDVYVARDVGDIHNGDLLQDGDGHWYTIVSYRNRTQIDDLSVIECEDRMIG